MSKRLFKTLVAALAIAAAAAGPVRGQNSSPDVTLDFTDNSWNIPAGKSNKTYAANSYTSGDYTITLQGGGSSNGYYFNNGYLMLGKSDAYLQLPAFSSAVDSIVVVGNNAASGNVTQNIYVDENNSWVAVSTQTTGATGTNTYVIDENYRAAGNIYFIKVDNAFNTQITYIKVYYVSSGGGSTPEPPTPGQNSTTYNVTFGGFSESEMNTTVNVTSLPQTFTAIGNDAFYPWTVISTAGNIFFGATVTSGGEGKVSVSLESDIDLYITITGPFEGTATIHVTGEDDENRDISCDITVSCVSNAPAAPTPHTVRFADGNNGWQVQDVTASASAVAPAVLQNVMAGDSLVVTAPASLPGKVKSVKAVKYVPPAATVTTPPTATEAYIEVGSTSALVNAGAANGGSMMYAVTTTNVQPASTADFSDAIPTAQGRTAGTYYVWYYAKADADHSDSEIAGSVSVTLAVMTTVTWNSSNVFNSANQNDQLDKWHPNPLTYEGITISFNGSGAASIYNTYTPDGETILKCYGAQGAVFTFTAPSGKKFCKIEIIDDEGITFTNYGDWTRDVINHKIVWSGTAANAVTLGGTNLTDASHINSIVFTLIDAQ